MNIYPRIFAASIGILAIAGCTQGDDSESVKFGYIPDDICESVDLDSIFVLYEQEFDDIQNDIGNEGQVSCRYQSHDSGNDAHIHIEILSLSNKEVDTQEIVDFIAGENDWIYFEWESATEPDDFTHESRGDLENWDDPYVWHTTINPDGVLEFRDRRGHGQVSYLVKAEDNLYIKFEYSSSLEFVKDDSTYKDFEDETFKIMDEMKERIPLLEDLYLLLGKK